MRTKTIVGGVFFVLASVALLVLAACGGGGGGSSSTAESDVVWPQTLTGDGINSYSLSTPTQFVVKEFHAGTLGLYASEQTYTAGIPATVGVNIHSIPAGTTLREIAENAISTSIGESVWTQNIGDREYIVHNEVLDESMEIVVFTTYFTDTKYLEIVAPTPYANSPEIVTMLSSLEMDM